MEFDSHAKLYFIDSDGKELELAGVSDLKPLVSMYDPDLKIAPLDLTEEFKFELDHVDYEAIAILFGRMSRITRAQMKHLNKKVAIAAHHLKTISREMSRELPENSRRHSEYRRRTKNRNKRK